jgi:hypothetical protein
MAGGKHLCTLYEKLSSFFCGKRRAISCGSYDILFSLELAFYPVFWQVVILSA